MGGRVGGRAAGGVGGWVGGWAGGVGGWVGGGGHWGVMPDRGVANLRQLTIDVWALRCLPPVCRCCAAELRTAYEALSHENQRMQQSLTELTRELQARDTGAHTARCTHVRIALMPSWCNCKCSSLLRDDLRHWLLLFLAAFVPGCCCSCSIPSHCLAMNCLVLCCLCSCILSACRAGHQGRGGGQPARGAAQRAEPDEHVHRRPAGGRGSWC